jgi:hypothetical protein
MPERVGAPSGFLLEFARGRFGWRFAVFDFADGYFPAPPAGDVPVPPDQQDTLLLVDGYDSS